jgi:hypothetical protein
MNARLQILDEWKLNFSTPPAWKWAAYTADLVEKNRHVAECRPEG